MENKTVPRPSVALLLGKAPTDDRATRPDARSRAERKLGRSRYKKAYLYYGKTYIVTRKQAISWAVCWIGTVLVVSAAISLLFLRWLSGASMCMTG